MPLIGIGNYIGRSGGSYWTTRYKSDDQVLFIAEIKDIVDGKLYNQKVGATDYLTVGGSAGSYTFQAPNTAAYIAVDTDYIWFKPSETLRTVTEAELIGHDLQRTPVKYLDDAPNSIEAIMIITSAFTDAKRDRLFSDFHLPVFWDNSLSTYGYVKSNRGATQQLWVLNLLTDLFIDTDGVHLHDHTMDEGAGWVDVGGNWQINGNRATQVTTSTSGYITVADSGESDIDFSLDLVLPNDAFYFIGGVFRHIDSTHMWSAHIARANNLAPKVYLEGIGGGTGGNYEFVHSTGAVKTIKVTTKGNLITVYLDGVQRIQVTDAAHAVGTKVGLREYRDTNYNTATFWDNFIVNYNNV